MRTSIFQSAINNWPENEAYLILVECKKMEANGYSEDDIARIKAKDISRMESIFDSQSDLLRFQARLKEGL